MALKKIGSPQKIHIIKNSAFAFDPNLITKRIKETWDKPEITKDQLHEAIKAIGIVNYSPEDLTEVIDLLNSTGIKVLD